MQTPVQQSLPLDCGNFNNRGLFADHFLLDPQRLRAMEEWKEPIAAAEVRDKTDRIYRKHASRFNSRTNEAQTEKDFIRPILNLLWGDDCYQVQVTIPNVEGRRQPDYAFFRTAEDRQEADTHKGTPEYWRDVPALGDAKAWESSLDRQSGPGENPSAQVCNYLYRSRVRWGILTNGRIWRLYERDRSSAGGIYYEVNLVDLLGRSDAESFKYFYLFFRREAFVPDLQSGLSFVEKVLKGSADYAAEVGERLKESVYDALRYLMNGFFAHSANALDSSNPKHVRQIHENSLILLYRLLFILYAEDRDILPCGKEDYSRYSLRTLHKEINENLLRGPYSEKPTSLWGRLCASFGLIDEGFEESGRVVVPAYNGGLFSPQKYPQIAHTAQAGVRQWRIGDRYLAEAIDLLAYKRKVWNKPTSDHVDYATLDVQHLGSIYEGLLELQPNIAAEPLVEISEKGKSRFRPKSEVPDPRPVRGQPPRRIEPGEVYPLTNRGERKATGSYYTPKYIVDYIVENTVGPVAEQAAKKVAELRAEGDKEIRKLERTRREWEKSSAREAPEHIAGLNKLIEDQKRRLLKPYLALKILDPAMGSGHFLVGAADHLSLAMATDPNLLPLEEIGDEDAQAYYKRLIVERCLCGVDLNPLAVELAKLSLWLHTVSKNKALSFLDHHFRCGNSLIGARIEEDLTKEPPLRGKGKRGAKAQAEQLVLGLFEALHEQHLVTFIDLLRRISETPTHDAETEKLKETWYAELEKARQKYRAVANCWLAPYFGAPVSAEQYQTAVQALRGSQADWQVLTQETWFQAAQSVARQKHFFHWELEFPEVFFDKHGFKPKERRGFDVVIGNPPYVGFHGMAGLKAYLRLSYVSCSGKFDIYVAFIERCVPLLRRSRCLSFICPSTFMKRDFAGQFRILSKQQWTLRGLVDFGSDRIFPEAANYTCIPLIANQVTAQGYQFTFTYRDLAGDPTLLPSGLLAPEGWILGQPEILAVLRKLMRAGTSVPLSTVVATISEGIVSACNEVFFIPQSVMQKERLEPRFLKRRLDGEHIHRFETNWARDFLIYPYLEDNSQAVVASQELLAKKSPNLWSYLCRNRKRLAGRAYFDRSTKEWYELWNQRSFALQSVPKIVVAEVEFRNKFAFADADCFYGDTVCGLTFDPNIPYSRGYFLALLNSKTLTFAMRSLSVPKANRYLIFKPIYLRQLPILPIAFTTEEGERARLLGEGKALCEKAVSAMTQGAK